MNRFRPFGVRATYRPTWMKPSQAQPAYDALVLQ
jgi:hypothetical protein